MSIYAPDPAVKRRRDALIAFLILSVFAIGFCGTALVLGVEPRLLMERTGERVFRVTTSSHFAGRRFTMKTIEGVDRVQLADARRNRPGDSIRERQRQTERKRLDLLNPSGAAVSWDREDDSKLIDDFMRSQAPTLTLTDAPPRWRMTIAWGCIAFAALIWIGAIQGFFPKNMSRGSLP